MVDIYRDAKRRGIYPPLFTDPEGDSCFIVQSFYGKKSVNLQLIATEGFSTVLNSAMYP